MLNFRCEDRAIINDIFSLEIHKYTPAELIEEKEQKETSQ